MSEALRSIERVCRATVMRGVEAAADAAPDLLLEVPHGATRAAHFDELREELRGDYDDGLRDFFFVNTDVGAPELAHAIARGVTEAAPDRTVGVLTCELPRTFCDTNRVVDADAAAHASRAGEMTPGLMPWVVDAHDRDLLLQRYFAYRDVVAGAFAAVCGEGGTALCVHTYAPRSLRVDVDENIGRSLRQAYAPDRIGTFALRPEIDLITHDEQDHELADAELARRVESGFAQLGLTCRRNDTYRLHDSTVACVLARRYPGRTLCFEVRRDLLLEEFVPFVELLPDPTRVARVAAPVVAALTRPGPDANH